MERKYLLFDSSEIDLEELNKMSDQELLNTAAELKTLFEAAFILNEIEFKNMYNNKQINTSELYLFIV